MYCVWVCVKKHATPADGLQLAPLEADGMFRVCQYGPLYSLGRVNDLLLAVNV